MKTFELQRRIWLPLPIHEVFRFFESPENLERITPPWLHFSIASPGPIEMRLGARIEYRLRVRGLPLRWVSEITRYDPPHVFVDTMVKGPYRLWVHEHRFEEHEGGTFVDDHVRYAVLGGFIVNALLVRPDLERIFCHREKTLRRLLAPDPAEAGHEKTRPS